MGFNLGQNLGHIRTSLENGELVHSSLDQNKTARSWLGRFFVQFIKLFGGARDYTISHLARRITLEINTQFASIDHAQAHVVINHLIRHMVSSGKNPALLAQMRTLSQRLSRSIAITQAARQAIPNLNATTVINPLQSLAPAGQLTRRATTAEPISTTVVQVANPMHPTEPVRPLTHSATTSKKTLATDVATNNPIRMAVEEVAQRREATASSAVASREEVLADHHAPMSLPRPLRQDELMPSLTAALNRRFPPAEIVRSAANLTILMNEKLAQIHTLKGTCIRIHKNNPIRTASGEELVFPFSGWIQVKEDGSGLRLQVIDPKVIGKGSYKKVKKSIKIFIPLIRSPTSTIQHQAEVITRTRGESSADSVTAGMILHQEIVGLVGPGVRLVPPAESFPTMTQHCHVEGPVTARQAAHGITAADTMQKRVRLETTQEWFNGDLHIANKTSSMPTSIDDDTPRHSLTFEDRLNISIDVTQSLAAMHAVDIVHRDVKPANVLLKIEADGKVHGYLADFDLATRKGMTDITNSYHYWDFCSKHGYASPSSDGYGIAMTLAETFIPDFYATYHANPSVLLQDPEKKWREIQYHIVNNTIKNLGFDDDSRRRIAEQFWRTGFDAAFDQVLRTAIGNRPTPLSDQQTKELRQLAINVSHSKQVFNLVVDLVRKDQELIGLVRRDPALQERMQSRDVAVKNAALTALSRDARIPSMTDIRDQCLAIRKSLQDSYARHGLT